MAAKSVGVESSKLNPGKRDVVQPGRGYYSQRQQIYPRQSLHCHGCFSWSCRVQSDDVACQDGLPDDGANISLSTTIVQVAMM